MKKILLSLSCAHALSQMILRQGILLSSVLLALSFLSTYLVRHAPHITATFFLCAQVYPLISLMVLALSVSGALLIDIYAKTQK